MIYWSTPSIIIKLFKKFDWHFSRSEKVIYLTFDDGPTPDITEQVLEMLQQFNAKATFFCLGRNVERHPKVFKKIQLAGHSIGNHTYSHLKGWRTSPKTYYQDTMLAAMHVKSSLFRPPYGRIKKMQTRMLAKEFRIIMWDVLSHDYDRRISRNLCLRSVLSSTKPGSIVVFHDSEKASKNLLYVLPRFLKHFSDKGFIFDSIPND